MDETRSNEGAERSALIFADATEGDVIREPVEDGMAIGEPVISDDFSAPVSPASSLIIEVTPSSAAEQSALSTIRNTVPFLTGRRIIDIEHFFSEMIALLNHGAITCPSSAIHFEKECRRGLNSTFYFSCKMCGKKLSISSEPLNRDDTMNTNLAATSGVMSIEGGHYYLEEFMGALNIPCMTNKTYTKNHAVVSEVWAKAAIQEMESAAREEVQLAIQNNDTDAEGCPCITVVLDGSWAKRSYRTQYNSLSGVAAIIGYRTRKVLFIGVRNKFCSICARAKSKNVIPKAHKCARNWEGPSTAMEADIILEGFMSSYEMFGLKYTRFIGDGDSNVHKVLLESTPYGITEVKKIECRNHVLRNYCNRLRHDVCSSKGNNRSSVQARNYVVKQIRRLRSAVVGAIRHRSEEEGSLDERVKRLKADILNGPNHVFGDHRKCARYFCDGAVEGVVNMIQKLKDGGIYLKVMEAVNRLAEHAPSLIHDCDSNMAEHYHSIVAKLTGGKRINYAAGNSYETRCHGAVLSYNSQSLLHSKTHKTIVQKSPGIFTKKMEQRRANQVSGAQKRRALARENNIPSSRRRRLRYTDCDADEHYGPNAEQPRTSGQENVEQMRQKQFLESLEKTPAERRKLEEETREQSKCSLWKIERKKLLTASNFGNICKMRKTTDPTNKVKQILNDFRETQAMLYGRVKEKLALEQLEQKLNEEVKSCGLFVDPEKPFLGATPDGLVGRDHIVEVKCPYVAKKISLLQAVKEQKISYLKEDENGKLVLKADHNYMYQIQGQLHITGRKFCYFVVWTPQEMIQQTIKRDDLFWKNKMVKKLQEFYMQSLLPELSKIFPPRQP